ncbi:uncharacterized protein LTR77_001583 [Saxophila tyrrhenica]|uniref:BTB domain-containing protein n=1 Tax=Saxophila tyrrhenica TaxID=1690608 RepID=A0AAV9PNA9_9PEZI|nr:hypothetical protein LTR77_001583 [Saxophila tyrrhenica]
MLGQFPTFDDGNVTIRLHTDSTLRLHSQILALHSKWFEANLSKRWTGLREGNSPDAATNQFAYQLRFDEDSALAMYVLESACTEGEFVDGNVQVDEEQMSEAEVELLVGRRAVIKAHYDMFRLMYHVPVHTVYSLENSFVEFFEKDTLAQHQVGMAPVDMLEIAVTYKSSWMFKEAAGHLVGTSNQSWVDAQDRLVELKLGDLFGKKRSEFISKLHSTDSDLFRMSVKASHLGEEPTHAFFRKWLAIKLNTHQGQHFLGDRYSETYRRIAQEKYEGNSVDVEYALGMYLQSLYGTWHSSGDIRKMLGSLHKVARHAKGVVEGIVRSKTEIEGRKPDGCSDLFCALTFVEIKDKELPWMRLVKEGGR